MFEIGDYIVCGNKGVCKVEDIGKMNLSGEKSNRIYYTLVPVHSTGSKVYTPTDNTKVIMRPVISKEEAYELIAGMKEIEELWVPDEKSRESIYKESIKKCDCTEWIKIIKTLYFRKQERIAEGKKITISDEKYLRLAEDNLYEEFAVALNMDKKKVLEYIKERVE